MKSLILTLIFFICGCTLPKRSVVDMKTVPPEQIILVGKLSIDKKLPKSTHVIDTIGITESGVIRAGENPQSRIDPRPSSFEKDDIMVKWDETFSVPFNKLPEINVSGMYAYTFGKFGQEVYMFPVHGSIHTVGGARYIYIGHISLKLDDFFTLKKVVVIDEFDSDKSLAHFKGIKKSLFRVQPLL